jgi:glycosyltransferase involved in cell wall biosynthesis
MLTIGLDASRAARAHRTGTETYSLNLILALADLPDTDTRLRLYTPHPPLHNHWPAPARAETRVIPFPRLWTHGRLALELYQARPDVLFVPAHVLPVVCPVPAVVTVHDLGYYHYPRTHPKPDRWYLHWSTLRHTRVASHILADSQATRQDLIELYGADPDRITVVYLGRDETLRRVEQADQIERIKQKYNIQGRYLLYLGTLHPRKNLVRLVEAFGIVAEQQPDIQLVIAGQKGWLYQGIFQRVYDLDLADRVIFTGFIDHADKAALLSGALVYAFPSLFEGFGLPVLEAMACGTPVLTSNVSSLPEVAGDAALLVNPLDTAGISAALLRLVTDGGLRQELTHRGYEQIKKFTWSRAARQVMEILKRVASNGQ